jgi:hypothetical protein
LIGVIKHALKKESLPKKTPLLLLVLVGIATFKISTSTLNIVLSIPMRDMTNLQGLHLISLQEEMSHVKYIFIDEMSLIEKTSVTQIDA